MNAAPESKSKIDSGGLSDRGGFVSRRNFRFGVTALIFVAFAFGSFEYITDKHRPNPFAEIEAINNWTWWRYPLPEASTEVMPWPVGINGKFIEGDKYNSSHAIEVKPGSAGVNLGDLGPIDLIDFAPFGNNSAWALAGDGKLYHRASTAQWQEHEINLIRQAEPQQGAPRISGQLMARPETNAPVVWAEFSPDGDTLVVVTEEPMILGWSVSKGDWIWRRDLPGGRYENPRFTLNQPWILLPGESGITIFNWIEAEIVDQLRSLKTPFTATAVTPRGQILTWDEAFGLQLWAEGKPIYRNAVQISDRVERLVTSPDGTFAALGTRFEIVIVDVDSSKIIQSIVAERGLTIQDFAFTAGGTTSGMGLIVRDESSVRVFDIFSGRSERNWEPSQVLNWSPLNNVVLGLAGKGGLTLWQYENDEFERFSIYGGSLVAASSPAGDLIAVQADTDPVRVFGRREREIATEIDLQGERSRQLIFNSSSSALLVVQNNADMSLWDVTVEIPQVSARQTRTILADQRIRAMQFRDSRNGLLIGDDNRIFVTADAGETWQLSASLPGPNEIGSNKLFAASFAGQLSGWIVGDDGLIFRTSNGGASWTAVEAPKKSLFSVDFANQDNGIAVGESGTILRSNNGGQTWEQIDIALKRDLRSVVLLPEDMGWISSGATGEELPIVLKTVDGGRSWQQVDYGELPAPLLLFIGIPLFGIAVFVVFYQKPEILETTGVDPVGTSDKPIGWDDPDPLNFKPIAKGLSYFLRNQDTEPPLTIGINGPWGTGKSSLMNLVMEDLRLYGSSPVWFNAWHHQKEEHLLAALLENIRKQAVPKLWQRDGISFRLRLLWLRTRGEVKTAAIIALGALGLVLLDQIFSAGRLQAAILSFDPSSLVELPGQLGTYLTAQTGVIGGSLAFVAWLMLRLRVLPSNPAKLLVGLGNRASVSGFSDQLGFRYKFGNEFREVCKALRSRHTPGLVILIDDLDRCQPQNVLEVLEAVNYLATVGDCFIILGMARRQVENCIAIGFKDFIVEGMEEQEHGLLQANNLSQPKPEPEVTKPKLIVAANPGAWGNLAPWSDAQGDDVSHATDNQRRFARRYLEKMINIEVAVPRGNPDQAAGLFAPEKSGSNSDSRFHQRQLLHKATGLVQVIALVFLLGIIGVGISPLLPQDEESIQPTVAQGEGKTRDVSGEIPIIPDPETVINATESDVTSKSEPTTTAAPLLTISPVPYSSLVTERSPLTWWGPPLLVFVTIILILIRRRLRPSDTDIQDTEGFTLALKRWYPLIYAVNPTPRAIKRFENRIRYIAMQARPPQQAPDFIDRIIDWFENRWTQIPRREVEEPQSVSASDKAGEYDIDDEMLVALGAVEALDPETIKDKGADEIEQLVSASTAELLGQMQTTKAKDDDQFVEQLKNLNQFIDAGKAWPPNPQDITDYRRLSGQIRG